MTVKELQRELERFADDDPVLIVYGMHTREVKNVLPAPDFAPVQGACEIYSGVRVG